MMSMIIGGFLGPGVGLGVDRGGVDRVCCCADLPRA